MHLPRPPLLPEERPLLVGQPIGRDMSGLQSQGALQVVLPLRGNLTGHPEDLVLLMDGDGEVAIAAVMSAEGNMKVSRTRTEPGGKGNVVQCHYSSNG